MSRVVVGVAGGIAAYKTCSLVRLFAEAGHEVFVLPTENSLNFVGEVTWAALSGNPVATSLFAASEGVPHVSLGQTADLVVVAPATADLLSRAAAGRADDLLTNVLLTTTSPVVFAPAMHTEMWQHPATQENVATLRRRGALIVGPDSGRLTGSDSGPGRMVEPEELFSTLTPLLDAETASQVAKQDLVGQRVLISAGGTREALDPVRFLGNRSSGQMGLALARAARLRGAEVTLVAANIEATVPGVEVVSVESTEMMAAEMTKIAGDFDLIIMAAAPADFTTASAATKIKKDGGKGLQINLVQTPDILAALVASRPSGQKIVGFAAETAGSPAELQRLGQEKLARKGCDLLVCNDVSGGAVFGSAENDIMVLGKMGIRSTAQGDKNLVAHAILTAARDEQE